MSDRGGRLVAFEGGEGCGKSTQARLLAEALGAVLTFEPGATPVGARIRELVLGTAVDPRAEALLMAADRAQHVSEVIRPALARGVHVVTDRFLDSSLAYQGFGRGLAVDELRSVSLWATAGVDADVVVLLDVPASLAWERVGAPRDRMEAAGDDFHGRVAEGFRSLAAAAPERWVVVDGVGSVDEVARRVRAAIEPRLER